MADPLLRVENLVRRFGGIVATDNLSLDVASGELHAIIGPTGAGKTTLISQLTGQLQPNSGAIHFAGLINLSSKVQFYYLCLACLFGGIYLVWRIVNSRFGMVVQGLRSNEARMQAIGFPATRYRLVCFVIAGTMCGLAGALLANNTDFVSPAVMFWTRSGDLMVMVILGGMGTLFGPVVGAIVYLVLEEFLSQLTEYWALIMGPLLLLIVLFGRGGIIGLLGRLDRG